MYFEMGWWNKWMVNWNRSKFADKSNKIWMKADWTINCYIGVKSLLFSCIPDMKPVKLKFPEPIKQLKKLKILISLFSYENLSKLLSYQQEIQLKTRTKTFMFFFLNFHLFSLFVDGFFSEGTFQQLLFKEKVMK